MPPPIAMSPGTVPDQHAWFLEQVLCHRPMLRGYLRKHLSSNEDIDDVVQEAFLRIYTMPDPAGIASPKAMLLTIAHNLAVELIRRRASRATDAVADFDVLGVCLEAASLDERVDAQQRFETFCAAVRTLPPVCQRVFVLRKVYRLSQEEISTLLGISQSTIEKHVAKGLVRCRDYLRERGQSEATAPAVPGEAQDERSVR